MNKLNKLCRLIGKESLIFRNKAFTLVELMVSILCVTIIMGAVMTWLMVGFRIETSAADTMEQQNKVRVIMSMIESMATSGKIESVPPVDENGNWKLLGKAEDGEENVLIAFQKDLNGNGKIASGNNNNILMERIDNSTAEFDSTTNLLKLTIITNGNTYSSDIYCRTKIDVQNNEISQLLNIMARKGLTTKSRDKFERVLGSQLNSTGLINQNQSFTEWYLGETYNRDEWSKDAPWCATYVSWAMNYMNLDYNNLALAYVPLFADVNHGREMFHEDYILGSGFTDQGGLSIDTEGKLVNSGNPGNGEVVWKYEYNNLEEEIPQKVGVWVKSSTVHNHPDIISKGDLIFFDWGELQTDGTFVGEPDKKLDHVGVVLSVDIVNKQIEYIEGNNSEGKVGIVKNYSLYEPYIVGYGILDWIEDGVSNP